MAKMERTRAAERQVLKKYLTRFFRAKEKQKTLQQRAAAIRADLGEASALEARVQAQAKEYGHSNRRELAYLVVHSVLHLLGYDHLDEGPEKARMRAREDAIMGELGIER